MVTMVQPIAITVGRFLVLVAAEPPWMLEQFTANAKLAEHFAGDDDRSDSGYSFVAVTDGIWPELVVTQRFAPAGGGFGPGILLMPDTGVLFIGAGTRLLGYRRHEPAGWRRLFVDEAELGFWAWRQHRDLVLMAAELELAAWSCAGEKLWTTFVEPPWSYDIVGQEVNLDVMGTQTTFDARSGPPRTS